MADLTVPRAGIDPGRAAEVRLETPQTGAALANFGQTMANVGNALEADRLDRQMRRLQVDLTRDMNNLQLELSQIGDPDQLEATYTQRRDALRKSYLEGVTEDGRARVDPRNAENFGLAFDELAVRHEFQIGRQALVGRFAQREATYFEYADAATTAASTADPDTREHYLAEGYAQIDALVQSGAITADEAARRKIGLRGDMSNAAATALMAEDPEAFLDAAQAGEFDGLGGERLSQYRARAEASMIANAKAAQVEADRQRAEMKSRAKAVFSEGVKVYGAGRDWSNLASAEAFLADPEIADTPEARAFVQAQALHLAMPEFSKLPASEKRRLLAEEEAKPIAEGFESDVAAAMRANIEADEKGFAADRFARAVEMGFNAAPELPDPAGADSASLAGALQERAYYSASLTEMGYVDDFQMFSPAEAEAWKAHVSVDAPPAERARIATAIAGAVGPEADRIAAELGADPVFSYVGGLIAAGGSERLAREIFSGQRAIAEKDVQMPPVTDRRQMFFGEFLGLFGDGTEAGMLDESGIRNQIIGAADALYAYRGRGRGDDFDGTIDEDLYLQSVHDVLGGTGDYDSSKATGGIQEIRGAMTLIPPGVRGADIEDALDFVRDAAGTDFGKDFWREVSASGAAPVIGGAPLSDRANAATWDRITLRASGPGRYNLVLRVDEDAPLEYVMGDDGAPFELDIAPLLTRMRRPQ